MQLVQSPHRAASQFSASCHLESLQLLLLLLLMMMMLDDARGTGKATTNDDDDEMSSPYTPHSPLFLHPNALYVLAKRAIIYS